MKKITALILAVFLTLSLCSCAASQTQQPDSTQPPVQDTEGEDAPVQPQVFKLALDGSVASLNYYTTVSDSVREIMTNCVDSLTEPDNQGKASEALADYWYANEDQSVWTFHLRSGIAWVDNNGNPTDYTVSSKDFVDGIKYIADPANGVANAEFVRSLIVGLSDYYSALETIDAGGEYPLTREEVVASFDETVGVKAEDEYTVKYSLTTSVPYFVSLTQSSPSLLPLEKDFFDECGEDYGLDNEHMLYCGPYYISHFERDKRIVLTKNPQYWDAESVSQSTIEYVALENGVSQTKAFMDGELSYAAVDVDDYINIQYSDYSGCLLPEEVSRSIDCFFLNFRSENSEFAAFVQNEDFRRALQYSLDRLSFAYLKNPVSPKSAVRSTISAPGTIFDSTGTDYTDYELLADIKANDYYDPDQARQYMQQAVLKLCGTAGNIVGASAGEVDCLPVTTLNVDAFLPVQCLFACSDSNDDIILAHLVKSIIEESIGKDLIEIEIVCIADWTKGAVIDGNNFDIILQPVETRCASPSVNLQQLVTDGDLNYGRFSIPEYDEYIANASLSPFFQIRLDMLSQAEALLLNGAYIIPVTSSGNAYYMTAAVPYSTPRTIFGSRRYKGLQLSENAVTYEEYKAIKKEYSK